MVTKETFYPTIPIVLVAYLLVSFAAICVVNTSKGGHQSSGIIDYVYTAQSSAPITAIYTTQSISTYDDSSCQEGYSPILLDMWPGNEAGCKYQSDYSTNCEYTVIDEAPPQPLYFWRGWGFCAKRSQDYYFHAQVGCQIGYKACNDNLCVAEGENCPITGINFIPSLQGAEDGVQTTIFNESHSLQFSREYGEQPIIKLQYSPNDKPCKAEGYWPPGDGTDVSLLHIDPKCGKWGTDEDALIIDSQSDYDFLKLQNNLGYISITDYDSLLQRRTAYLTVRTRLDVLQTSECQITLTNNEKLAPQVRSFRDDNVWSIVGLVFCCIISFTSTMLLLTAACGANPECYFVFGISGHMVLTTIGMIFTYIFIGNVATSTSAIVTNESNLDSYAPCLENSDYQNGIYSFADYLSLVKTCMAGTIIAATLYPFVFCLYHCCVLKKLSRHLRNNRPGALFHINNDIDKAPAQNGNNWEAQRVMAAELRQQQQSNNDGAPNQI